MTNLDQVILVDEQDRVIGSLDKVEAHRGEGKLHRASSVFLFRKNSVTGQLEVLLQQRSNKKIVAAGQWANTCCGNVRPGESYEQCILRRLQEELGILVTTKLSDVFTFTYQVKCNEHFSEHEIDHIFVGWYDREVTSNPDEVAAVEWVEWQKFVAGTLEKTVAPWVPLMLEDDDLLAVVQNSIH